MSGAEQHLRLYLFGGLRAVLAGTEAEVTVSSRKAKGLLAYLALSKNGPISRETLAALLWDDRAEAQARQSLRQCLAVLRREIQNGGPELLQTPGDGVLLARDLVWSDVAAFEADAASGDLGSLRRAADLYAGDLLVGLSFGEEFDTWVSRERQRLHDVAGSVMQQLAAAEEQAGDVNRAVAAAQRLVGLDPLREDAQRLLIRLLARHRGRAAALRQFEACVDILRRELDVTPDEATLALAQEVRTLPEAVTEPREGTAKPLDLGGEPVPALPLRSPVWRRPVSLAAASGVALALAVAAISLVEWFAGPMGRERPPAITDGRKDPSPPRTGRISIAVLPFTGHGSADVERLADTLTDELTTDLSRFQATDVAPLRSALAFKGRVTDVKDAGRILGVAYVLEGSVRIAEGRMRVNVQLVDAHTGVQIWTDRFERDQAERLAVQNEVLARLGRAMQVQATLAESERVRAATGSTPPSLDDLLMQAWALTVGENPVQARPQFEAILAQYPTSAGAMEGVAVTNAIDVLAFTAADPKGQLETAERLIGEAQKLRPNSARVHYVKGVTLRAGERYEEALVALEHALSLNHGFTHVHAMVGETMMKLGRVEEGLARLDQAMRLSPNDGSFGKWLATVGYGHLLLGRYDESVGFLRRAIDRRPGSAPPLGWLAAAEMLRGNRETAETAAREFRRRAPRGDAGRLLGLTSVPPAYQEQGQRLLDAMRQAGIEASAQASNH